MKKITIVLAGLLLSIGAFAADLTIGNSKTTLTFASDDWHFKSFVMDGHEILPAGGTKTPAWMVDCLGPRGEAPSIQPRFTYFRGGELSEDGRSVTFRWDLVLEREARWPLLVTVSLPAEDSLPEWSISAELPAGWKISSLEFPRISVSRPDGVKGILPVGYGAEYNIGGMIQAHYPSCTGGLDLVMAYAPSGTLYFSPKDYQACDKYLQIRGDGNTLTFVQKLDASYGWTNENGAFALPWPTILAWNRGNWDETALEWYRPFALSTEWGAKSLSERNVAKWIKEADVWIRPQDVTPAMQDLVMKSIDTFGKGLGIHWYYWHNHPFDSYYPEYFPAKETFADCVAKAQKAGAHVTPYINGRLWDASTESYETDHGYEASCRKKDGSLYTEIYSSKVVNTVTCPSSKIWSDKLHAVCDTILSMYRTDGVYIDQIGCASPQSCYAANHDHSPGGGGWWVASYREMLQSMRKNVFGPCKAVTTEENSEPYIDLFDMMLVVNGPHRPDVHMIPLFPLIYSDRCIYSGFTYIPWKLNNGSFNFLQMKSLLWGSQLGWVNPEMLFKPGCENEVLFLKNLGAFRKKQHDCFVGGRFLKEFAPVGDNPVLDVPGYQKTNVVMGAEWLNVEGKKVIFLVNMSGEDHNVTLPDGTSVTVKAYNAVRK